MVLPWEVHASRAEGRFVMLSTGGVPSMRDGLTFGVNADKGYRHGIYVPDAIRTVMINFYAKYDSLDSFGAIAREGMHELVTHPVGMAGLVGMKLLRAWYGTDSQRLDLYIALVQVVYLALLARAARVAWRSGGERRRSATLVMVLIAYFWLMSALALPLVRYMVPAIGLGFLWLPVLAEKQETRRDVLATLSTQFARWLCSWRSLTRENPQWRPSTTDYNICSKRYRPAAPSAIRTSK